MDRYEEALEKARARKSLEEIFPELKESEDERIRKAIVRLLTVASESYLIDATGFKKEQFLSYLEKQKEQKGANGNEKEIPNGQKPAVWSEEDEKHIEALILASDRCMGKWHCCNEQCEISEHLDWLKSLRPPQYCENCKLKRSVENWKPSYEQMEALNEAVGGFRMEDTASCEKTADTLE